MCVRSRKELSGTSERTLTRISGGSEVRVLRSGLDVLDGEGIDIACLLCLMRDGRVNELRIFPEVEGSKLDERHEM